MNSFRYKINEFVADNLEEIKETVGFIPSLETTNVCDMDLDTLDTSLIKAIISESYFAGCADTLKRIKLLLKE